MSCNCWSVYPTACAAMMPLGLPRRWRTCAAPRATRCFPGSGQIRRCRWSHGIGSSCWRAGVPGWISLVAGGGGGAGEVTDTFTLTVDRVSRTARSALPVLFPVTVMTFPERLAATAVPLELPMRDRADRIADGQRGRLPDKQ